MLFKSPQELADSKETKTDISMVMVAKHVLAKKKNVFAAVKNGRQRVERTHQEYFCHMDSHLFT